MTDIIEFGTVYSIGHSSSRVCTAKFVEMMTIGLICYLFIQRSTLVHHVKLDLR